MTETNTYDVQLFENTEFNHLTVLVFEENNNEVYFIAKEVAEILGYVDYKQAIRKHIDADDKMVVSKAEISKGVDLTTLENIPNRGLTCINESGLYSLILSSKLPSAKKFKRWVTCEVLPSIRKHGAYMTQETALELLNDPEQRDKMLSYFAQGILDRDKIIEEKNKMIDGLTTSNNELALTNAALAEKVTTWDDRRILNALVRSYANNRCNGEMQVAWNYFYKQINYALGINIWNRKSPTAKSRLDLLTEDELKSAVSVVAALCEHADLNVGKIIGETNAKNIKQSVVPAT